MAMRTSRLLAIVAGVVILLSAASTCYAQDPGKKLGRGIVNIFTGWVELPKNVYQTTEESNAFAGMTIGLVKGLGMTIVRTGAGIFDAATFPFPVPKDYKPVLEPEYVLEKKP